MEEVARAAGISRQSLYVQFSAKEPLFKAVVIQSLESSLLQATLVLNDPSLKLPAKIVKAFDKWEGEHIQVPGVSRWELIEAAFQIVGEDLIKKYQSQVRKELEKTLNASAINTRSNFSIRELAEVLQSVAHGLAAKSSSRNEWTKQMKTAVRVITTPLIPI